MCYEAVLCGPERGHVLFVHLIDFGIFDRQHDPSPTILLATLRTWILGYAYRTNIDVQNQWFAGEKNTSTNWWVSHLLLACRRVSITSWMGRPRCWGVFICYPSSTGSTARKFSPIRGCQWVWTMDMFWIVLDCFGLFWIVLDCFGLFWIVVVWWSRKELERKG